LEKRGKTGRPRKGKSCSDESSLEVSWRPCKKNEGCTGGREIVEFKRLPLIEKGIARGKGIPREPKREQLQVYMKASKSGLH